MLSLRRSLLILGSILLPLCSAQALSFRVNVTSGSVQWASDRMQSLGPDFFEPVKELTGARDTDDPIHVLIADESAPIARQTPRWIAGFASGPHEAIVLFPTRAADYPNDGFDELVLHEVTHILVSRAAGQRPVPRWFNEGLAMTAGRSWSFADRRRLTVAIVTGNPVSLDQIERAYSLGEVPAGRAYALSEALVRDIIRHKGPAVIDATLRGVANGLPFDQSFERATSESLDSVVAAFWKRQTFWNRWVPVATSGLALWIAVTFLALWAFRRRRARDAAIRAKWEEEELIREMEPPNDWVN